MYLFIDIKFLATSRNPYLFYLVYMIIHMILCHKKGVRRDTSLWGHLLFGMDLEPLDRQNPVVRSVAAKRLNERPLLGF